MAVIDWVIVGLYLSCALGIGIYFTKRASKSTSAFFVAGRTLPWYIAGTSMVATTFAADTPLWVAGTSRQTGIFNNWIWWSSAFGFSATVFFFARLWRRTEILTDIELVAKRYEPSKARNALRIFRVFFDGVMINCTIIAWITLAMVKIIKCVLGLSEGVLFTVPFFGDITPTILLLLILGAAAVTYTTLSGLYGVAYSDLIAFIMAMGGSIALAVIIYVDASSGEGLIAKISAAPEYKKDLLKFFPDLTTFNLVTFTFFVYVFMRWWEQAPGAYYLAQRMLATRSEKDSVLAFLWFNICQFVIRPWPWILVGILSLHYLPRLDDPETAFPLMIARFMPIGLKGLVVTSLFAAFMSSIDTQLNLGTSYLINDFYRPYVSKNKSPRHYVLASRIVMILMTLAAILVATKLKSVFTAWKYIVVIVGGLGTVMIARWYWWRVNAYSEISAMVTCFFVANGAAILLPST
ncbi:MAG: sodium:solute symporter family protein, partial [Planctomycetota bacterium]